MYNCLYSFNVIILIIILINVLDGFALSHYLTTISESQMKYYRDSIFLAIISIAPSGTGFLLSCVPVQLDIQIKLCLSSDDSHKTKKADLQGRVKKSILKNKLTRLEVNYFSIESTSFPLIASIFL